MTSNMSLVRCRDVVEEGLVFLFVQVLLLAGAMRVFLCLAPILNSVKEKKNLVKTPMLWIPRLKLLGQAYTTLAN